LISLYDNHPQINAIASLSEKNCLLSGLNGSGKAVITTALYKKKAGVFLCLLNDIEDAGYFYNDIAQLLNGRNVYFYPSAYHRHIKYGHIDSANEILRTETLGLLQEEKNTMIIVTYPDAVSEKVLSKKVLQENTLMIHTGEKLDIMFVSDVLDSYGFEYTDYVYEPGQYAMRGSILDIFSFSNEYPFRIDFFGNEVESIRSFDVETQLSKEKLTEVRVIPEISKHKESDTSLFDLLPDKTVIVSQDMEWCRERINSLWNETPVNKDNEGFQDVEMMRGKLITADAFEVSVKKFQNIHFQKTADSTATKIQFETAPQPLFQKNFDLVSESLSTYISDGYKVFILSDSTKQTERIKDIFNDKGYNIDFVAVNHTLHEGYVDSNIKICLFTDHQIFGRFHKYSLKSDKARSGKLTLSLKELNQFSNGDYIVHIDHGIGQFGGLVRTDVSGKLQEAVKLIYKNNDVIFVSIHSLHKLSKYKGKDGEPPLLSKLGTGAWEKMKDRTKKKVKDIARDLIKLYAKRKDERGFAFSPDSFMQDELEASFMYEDTPDQLKATNEVKADMERERPMDRLICGDVGFGKTEVSIRAAFKAVADSKQVALLVPTTVLAFQHYQTFNERLKNFPCSIDYISRARSTGEVRKILDRLESGQLDIIIGTHRLVSKDVKFNDLGLLVIDEEQKFGVSIKEKLRQMKSNVDTLTMTATPIPRTLQFSLMGARDLSNIHTPPPNRYPIQTEIERFNPDIIREAIAFEMSRNGQIFIINNRIQNIYEIEALVKREVPDARIIVGHGQMDPEKLEKNILDFVNYEYDVLIATTIIENGIDVPNANTIIINNAHQFGLSELHQLRGRVGRSNRKAFCYLLAPPLSTLPSESRRRLQAIENFAELGSGIHIAMQDLDIRGAGNMLGAEQSGFIADVGYETYQKILEEAVDELKTEEFSDIYVTEENVNDAVFVRETFIESDLELLFPQTYIPSDTERVSIYRELDKIEDDKAIEGFVSRLTDRFGAIPPEGEELIRIVHLRRLGKQLGFDKIVLKRGVMNIHFVKDNNSPYYKSNAFGKLLAYIQKYPKKCNLKETAGKRSLIISNIPDVRTACLVLEEMQG
ncbi:MAG: transcription-repair coupling factor, partial [Tannerella sp.]|nr:transcription-repair coupling factor [Tannerella sp.]